MTSLSGFSAMSPVQPAIRYAGGQSAAALVYFGKDSSAEWQERLLAEERKHLENRRDCVRDDKKLGVGFFIVMLLLGGGFKAWQVVEDNANAGNQEGCSAGRYPDCEKADAQAVKSAIGETVSTAGWGVSGLAGVYALLKRQQEKKASQALENLDNKDKN